ncbi:PAS domain-containing sensor histidine kinase [Herbiconiux sp. CPCC 203407]|uniref:histidine kinase n=1 Tax=Herbiconiux oxytropis TaxID=2970915 RepID=A0AA41XGX6_9MICO|nr:PAS domain-containing sensor histidine kinase [Herbiconiux oxytropis]MCS5721069.1 PAS domain-containing sensor histidine kinase [Herbiconiux oxytropis]MCS5724721.1 PAS domain-containing sensor histidine kinase [Herbiconiux oxytropis]
MSERSADESTAGTFGSWPPLLKHGAALTGFALATLILVSPMDIAAVVWPVVVADALMLAAAVFAIVLPRSSLSPRWEIVIPLVTFVAVALLRTATGGQLSPFGALMIIPVVWIASQPGLRYVLISFAGVLGVVAVPFVVGISSVSVAADVARLVFTPAVFAIAAVLINQIARVQNDRLVRLQRLGLERDRLVQSLEDSTREALRRQEQTLEAARLRDSVWEAITGHAIIGTDLDGTVNVWNRGAVSLLGYSSTEAIGRLDILDVHPRYDEARSALRGGADAPEATDWTYARKDGTTFPAHVLVTERFDEDGDPAGFIFVATDETEATELQRLKDEFTSLISHELRTPLSSILGYVELLRPEDDFDDPMTDQQLKYLDVVDRNARRLLQLVGDLLFTAQVGSGRFTIEPVPTSLTGLVRAAVDTATPAADEAHITLTVVTPDDDVNASVDPVRIGQALDNLLSNAVKFTPRGGSVTIGLESAPGAARLIVADTGIGIPADEVARLSERFFRASTATQHAVKGVGLGLTITKAIVTAHAGTIDIDSTVGAGTTFTVELPL